MLDTENRPEDVIQHAIKERVAEDRFSQQIKDSTRENSFLPPSFYLGGGSVTNYPPRIYIKPHFEPNYMLSSKYTVFRVLASLKIFI